MKRFRKAMLAAAVLLGVVVAGSIWLFDSALNVASDAVDSALGGAHQVQVAAQKEVIGAARDAQNGANSGLSDARHPLDAMDESAPAKNAVTAPPINKVPYQTAGNKTRGLPQQSAKQTQKDSEASPSDVLTNPAGLLSLFLDDGEDTPDLTSLWKSGDKQAKGDKPRAKNADDIITDLIPGADSPTVKHWMDGKYKGNESQALDDAIEDPKIWRLMFFLGGNM